MARRLSGSLGRTAFGGAMLLVLSPWLAVAQPAAMRAEGLQFSAPVTIAQLDMGKLKGEPRRLAWSPDGLQLYVQTAEAAGKQPNPKLHHYVFAVEGGTRQDVKSEPDWASAYWTVKSGQAAPGDARMKIELKTDSRQDRTTAVPMGGELARGGVGGEAGTSSGDAGAAAYQSQVATVHTMLLKGEPVGEFVNSVIVPGLTFGWGPKESKAIAYTAPKSGRVVVMDQQGVRKEIDGSSEAVLPAWSPDGSRIAWLQRDGRKKFVLQASNVSVS